MSEMVQHKRYYRPIGSGHDMTYQATVDTISTDSVLCGTSAIAELLVL